MWKAAIRACPKANYNFTDTVVHVVLRNSMVLLASLLQLKILYSLLTFEICCIKRFKAWLLYNKVYIFISNLSLIKGTNPVFGLLSIQCLLSGLLSAETLKAYKT